MHDERGSAGSQSRRAARVLAVGVATIAGAVLTTARSLDAWFVGDDLGEIHRAEYGDDRGAHVRPLVTLGLRVSRAVGDLDPVAYHVVGVVLHACVIGLVGWVASGLGDRGGLVGGPRRALPWVSAATFALLGTHAEAVSWISTRGDLVATGAALVAVGAWARRDRERAAGPAALIALVVGLAAKEHAVVIPLLCLVVSLTSGRPSWRRVGGAARSVVPLLVVAAGYVVVRAVVLGAVVASYDDAGFEWSPVSIAGHLASGAVRTVVPGTDREGWTQVALAVVVVALVLAAHRGLPGALRSPSARVAATAGFLGLVALLPMAGLGVSLTDGRGDRLLYLPSAFVAVGVAAAALGLLEAVPGRARRVGGGAVLLALLLVSGRAAVERDGRWDQAGHLAEATLGTGARWNRPRQVVVLNPADTLRGAYVHRNALGDAGVVVHGWPAPSLVEGLAPMEIDDAAAGATAERVDRRRWLLRPTPGRARFIPPSSSQARTIHGVTAHWRADGTVEVTVADDVALEDVWVLVGGRFTDLAAIR